MKIKNPNKNSELKVLLEVLKEKNIISDADFHKKEKELKK